MNDFKRKRLLCAALVALLTLPLAHAQEVTPAPAAETPTQSATESSTQAATESSTQAATESPTQTTTDSPTQATTDSPTQAVTESPTPTVAPSASASTGPTASPSASASTEPTVNPSASASPEPTVSPSESVSPEPTVSPSESASPEPTVSPSASASPEPSVDPSASVSPEPSVTPTPGALSLSAEGGTLSETGVWQIALQMPATEIAFTWNAVEGATAYLCEVYDEAGNSVYSAQQAECRLSLPVQDYASGQFSLRVQALDEAGAALAEETILFALTQGGNFPGGGGFPSGGGGSFPSGGSTGALPEEEQGFHVTPGEALTSDHASGTKDMRAYGTVELTSPETAVTRLTLGETELDVSLDDETGAFTVQIDADALLLAPESAGETWSVSAYALGVLQRSGVSTLNLKLNDEPIEIPTDLEFSGSAYAALRAQGYVSKDFTLEVSAAGIAVEVDGQRYQLSESGELTAA